MVGTRAVLLAVAAAGMLAVGGCDSGAAAQPANPSATASSTASPLDGIDATVDQIERQVDSDGATAG